MGLYVGDTKYKVMVGNQKEDFKVPLPYDAEVEYLKSSGTQYIDTGITYSSSDAYVIECGIAIHDSGTLTGNGWDAGGMFGQLTGKPTNGDGNGFGVNIQNTYVVMTLTINAGTSTQSVLSVNVNGTTYSRGRAHSSLGTYASTYGYLLFAVRSKTSVSYKASESIYYCKIEKNNILVRNFIPVRVGQVGYLYDKVSGQLFGNAGTGNFTLGKDKTLPYDAEVEYIESTGTSGFYIDTGIGRPSTFASAEIQTRVQFTSTSGRQIAGATNDFYFGVNANRWECNYNTYNGTADTNIHDFAKRMTITNNRNYLNVYLDGSSIWSNNITYNASQFGVNIGIFNYSVNSTTGWQAKVFSAKVYVNDELVFDGIPVRKNGMGYLYDKISSTLFGNEGTGSFVIGPDVCIKPYDAEVEYLESSGTQYIDTGIAFNGLWNLKCSCQNTDKTSSARDRRYFGGFYGWVNNGVGWAENAFLYMGTHPTVRTYNNINRGYLSLVGNSVSITGNATYSASVTRVDSTSPVSLTLFAEKRPTSVGYYLTGRIYYFSMGTNTDANNIIDLIPVRKDGIGYMYDKVSGTLFGNAGSGAFTYGNDVTT